MSTGINRRSSRTYASRLDDEWQLDTNWTAKPTWKVEQIFFCISILYRHLSRHFYCFCITTGWIFVPSVVWLMELGLLLLPSQKSCFRHDQDTCNDNSLNTIAWLLLPRKNTRNELEELGNDNCLLWSSVSRFHIVWKSLKMSHLNFTTLAFYTICSFWPVW